MSRPEFVSTISAGQWDQAMRGGLSAAACIGENVSSTEEALKNLGTLSKSDIDKALLTKVSINSGTITDTLNNAVNPGRWTVAVPNNAPGNPFQSQYDTLYGFLDVFIQSSGQWVLQVFSPVGSEFGETSVYFRKNINKSGWTAWYLFALAVPPAVIDLSLSSGLSVTHPCKGRKNNFGEVHIGGALTGSISVGSTLANLPIGYRPSYTIESPAVFFLTDGSKTAGSIAILVDGKIIAYPANDAVSAVFSASFIAV